MRGARVGRLVLSFGATFTLAVLAAGGGVFLLAEARLESKVDASLAADRDRMLGASGKPVATLPEVAAKISAWEANHGVRERGHLLLGTDGRRLAGAIMLTPPRAGFADVRFREPGTRLRDGRALVVPSDGGVFIVVAHSEIAEDMLEILPELAIAIVLAAIITGLGASWLFARLVARRLSAIRLAADAIAAGDTARRVPTATLDGLFAEQAESFNRMLDRIDDVMRAQRQFTGNLAHDLRTPLTRLRGILAQTGSVGPSAVSLQIERANRECASIIAIFDALLRLSEIEAGRNRDALAPIDPALVVEDVIETMEPVLADDGRLLVAELERTPAIAADPRMITQLLVNLLENVAHHTPCGTTVRVRLTTDRTAGEVILDVIDDGPGIPGSAKDRLVRPFERGGSADLANAHGGSGLGLAIAQAIVRFHGGTIELGDAAPGLALRMRFPALGALPGTTQPAARTITPPARVAPVPVAA
jgi:signal transduction histidine kinase